MQLCLKDPTEIENRSYCLQWEFTSVTISINVLTLSHYYTITTQSSNVLLNITIKSPNKHLISIQPQLMAFCLCTALTHPTTLSFGTLQIHLPALANLANVLSFLYLFICDSSPSESNLLQMKSLQASILNPNFPGYQRKSYHL